MTIQPQQIEKAIALAKDFGATRLVLFGSALVDPAQAHDLDLACDGVNGWELYELGARIEDELNTPIDLVPLTPLLASRAISKARARYCWDEPAH